MLANPQEDCVANPARFARYNEDTACPSTIVKSLYIYETSFQLVLVNPMKRQSLTNEDEFILFNHALIDRFQKWDLLCMVNTRSERKMADNADLLPGLRKGARREEGRIEKENGSWTRRDVIQTRGDEERTRENGKSPKRNE
ncbi:hypothetical protein AVEN_194511-1 [Araneus ventricosus]|uniref:Uncharacterized protein n=1 Tax=Araneus ventricosus TaxID=182803 RepID=A0A4Y2A794_ARAVE|nr:hypothetical protein AVEN_194511-1 [Araneus ventricosus]